MGTRKAASCLIREADKKLRLMLYIKLTRCQAGFYVPEFSQQPDKAANTFILVSQMGTPSTQSC